MIIKIIECDDTYTHLVCGQILDTDDVNCPITYAQAWALCTVRKATKDLSCEQTRDNKYDSTNEYTCRANMVYDSAMYQLKPEIIEASNPLDLSEWDLILQGA